VPSFSEERPRSRWSEEVWWGPGKLFANTAARGPFSREELTLPSAAEHVSAMCSERPEV